MFKNWIVFLLLFVFCLQVVAQSKKDLTLWYNKPDSLDGSSARWKRTLGAMVFGGVDEELIQLNEATLWSGGPVKNNVNPASPRYLQPLRDALFKRDYKLPIRWRIKCRGCILKAICHWAT